MIQRLAAIAVLLTGLATGVCLIAQGAQRILIEVQKDTVSTSEVITRKSSADAPQNASGKPTPAPVRPSSLAAELQRRYLNYSHQFCAKHLKPLAVGSAISDARAALMHTAINIGANQETARAVGLIVEGTRFKDPTWTGDQYVAVTVEVKDDTTVTGIKLWHDGKNVTCSNDDFYFTIDDKVHTKFDDSDDNSFVEWHF
jgi:hypothetical protein